MIHEQCWSCRLKSAIVMIDRHLGLLPLALRSVNAGFELPTVFIFKYFINGIFKSHLVAFFVQKCAKTSRDRVFPLQLPLKDSCLSEGATVTKAAGLTDRPIMSYKLRIVGYKLTIKKKKVYFMMKKNPELWDPRKKSELRDVNSEIYIALLRKRGGGGMLQEMQWFHHWFC